MGQLSEADGAQRRVVVAPQRSAGLGVEGVVGRLGVADEIELHQFLSSRVVECCRPGQGPLNNSDPFRPLYHIAGKVPKPQRNGALPCPRPAPAMQQPQARFRYVLTQR